MKYLLKIAIKSKTTKPVIKTFVLSAILLFAVSCTYEFSEDFYKEIQPNNPNVNISLTGFSNGEETNISKTIQYEISGVTDTEFEMLVKVDGVEISQSNDIEGDFYLYIDDLEDGEHQLRIEYYFPSNTGSLVDSLGGEYFIGEAIYYFTVDKTLASPFNIASVSIVDGSIYIALNPINDINFDEAFLVIQNEEGYPVDERLISTEDLADLEIHDDQTIIYNPSYAIKVKNSFFEETSGFTQLQTPKMDIIVEQLAYESYKLIYNEHPLYGNFDTMSFVYYDYLVGNSYYSLDPLGGESIVNANFYFGTSHSINMRFFKNNSIVENSYDRIQIGSNLPISDFEEITYITSIDKYFIIEITNTNELIIHQLNGQTFEIENSQSITTLDFSVDFKSLDVHTDSNMMVINMNKKAIVFNPITFTIQNTYNAIDFTSSLAGPSVYYREDYVILEEPWESGHVKIYEITTGIEKFSINKTTNFFSAIDASFFYANGDLYRLEAGEFVFVQTIQDSRYNTAAPALEHMTFDKVSNSAVFGWYRSTFYLDLSDYNQTYIWDTEIVYDVKYTDDGRPLINCNHFSGGNKSHIYDINNNETKLIDTSGYLSFRYFNGFLFAPNGYYLETNLYDH